MPLIEEKGPPRFINGHIETVIPALLRSVRNVPYKSERWELPDDDFLDVDTLIADHSTAVIVSHGLEGSSKRPYMKGMSKYLFVNNFDVFAWNFRGCSGEINRQRRFYHSGATDDLDFVVQTVLERGYKNIYLVGFSLGGNLTLKYLGEAVRDNRIKAAAVYSVPMHLHSACQGLMQGFNKVYSRRFLRHLKEKVVQKAKAMPQEFDLGQLNSLKTLIEFDDKITAPLHGFADAIDYYESCSSLYFLDGISIPVQIVNARNDSFLSARCYPTEFAKRSDLIHLQTPQYGGHVGFAPRGFGGYYWSEIKAAEFFMDQDFF